MQRWHLKPVQNNPVSDLQLQVATSAAAAMMCWCPPYAMLPQALSAAAQSGGKRTWSGWVPSLGRCRQACLRWGRSSHTHRTTTSER